jgi:hypothetical protein
MQETGTGNVEAPPPARRALSPLVAVGVAAFAILVGAGALVIIADGQSKPASDIPAGPAIEAEDTETDVLASLELLLERKDRAFDTHNLDMLRDVYVDESGTFLRAESALKRLIRFSVYDRARYEPRALDVNEITQDTAVVEYTYVHYPCFQSASGKDVTKATGVVEKRALYTLHTEDDKWQIYAIELVGERVLRQEDSSCERV